jgi:hypothetical protein
MTACAVCKSKVETTFLEKPLGTYLRDAKGKRRLVCRECQRTTSIEGLKAKL